MMTKREGWIGARQGLPDSLHLTRICIRSYVVFVWESPAQMKV